MIKVGSDFSGVGAFNQALKRLGIEYDELFACDMDKYARQTFELNYGKPKDFPFDVYEREIPKESLDIYMTSPPCQAFSLAGKRLGKEDKRGILFFNSLEFIQENKPRYFIFENVKGLLSHDKQDKNAEYGRTFQEWINYLGGKSVNGVHTFFPIEDSVPYHIYFQVLNAKHYGIPQNRERIFIIGIRDDEDNDFQFPKPFPLEKRLKDVLETEVDEKYFLSDKMLELIEYNGKNKGIIADLNKGGQKGEVHADNSDFVSCLTATDYKQPKQIQIGTWRTHEDGKGFRATEDNNCPTIPARAREDGSGQPVIKVNSNFGNKRLDETLNSKEVPEEDCIIDSYNKTFHTEVSPSISTRTNASSFTNVKIGAIRGRNPENPKSRQSGLETEQMLEINENGTFNALTTVQKDNVVIYDDYNQKINNSGVIGTITCNVSSTAKRNGHKLIISSNTNMNDLDIKIIKTTYGKHQQDCFYDSEGIMCAIPAGTHGNTAYFTQTLMPCTQRIRRLTPLECFRLMDFNEDFKWNVSDSQAYKQAGNSICVGVLAAIISKLKL